MNPRVPSIIFGTLAMVYLTALPNAQAPTTPPATPAQVAFARDIQPIIEKSCAGCHSADLKLAELDLSTREAAMKGGEHGAVIVPGSADKSKLYRMVAGLDEPAMPMEGDALKPAEVAAIKAWIDQGAKWETAISFAKDIQPIMERSCWNCHGASMQLSNSISARAKARCAAASMVRPSCRVTPTEPAVSRGRQPRQLSRCRWRATS